jgi:hypothetical protein
MERVAIIAHLKEGSEQRAAEFVGAGLPCDLADAASFATASTSLPTRSCSCSRATRSSGTSTS